MEKELLEASKRWKEEGKKYKDALNDWLDIIYVKNDNPSEECPNETREDMLNYVFNKISELSDNKEFGKARELFPPDSDPFRQSFDNRQIWHAIRKVTYLPDGRILVKIGNAYAPQGVFVIKDNDITHIENLIAFGVSHDKRYFAKVYENEIHIHEGWDGVIVCKLSLPDNMSIFDIEYENIEVFADGKQVVLVTYNGIFLINENGSTILHGGLNDDDEYDDDDDNNNNNNEPIRPAHIPAEAKWNASENEWGLGKKNSQGNNIGEWKWWLAPKGYLCCHTFFKGDDGDTMSFTRYHADGTPSRIGFYVEGEPIGDLTWIRSDNPTMEEYPPNARPDVWKTVSTIKNGYTVEEHYFDKAGKEIQEPYIGNVEMSELLKKMGILNRLYVEKNWNRLLQEAQDLLDDDDDLLEENKDKMEVVYYKVIAMYELNNRETNEDIEELADRIDDLDTFQIWNFLPEYQIAKEARKFSSMILGKDQDESESEDPSERYESLKYPHAALSPDGKYIALGSQDSSHIVMGLKDGQWEEIETMNPGSEYPNAATFNYKTHKPIVAFSSCHMFTRSVTFGATISSLGNPDAAESSDSTWNMDKYDLFNIDPQHWIVSYLSLDTGFWLGGNDGYIWHRDFNTGNLYYVYIGGEVLSMDISSDGKYMVLGTHAGQVNILKLAELSSDGQNNPRVDPYLITNTAFVDEKRYLFSRLDGFSPIVW